VEGRESKAFWISTELIAPDNGNTVGLAKEVSAAARRAASSTNINQPIVHFTAPALLTSWKLVYIKIESRVTVKCLHNNIVQALDYFTYYFHFFSGRALGRVGRYPLPARKSFSFAGQAAMLALPL